MPAEARGRRRQEEMADRHTAARVDVPGQGVGRIKDKPEPLPVITSVRPPGSPLLRVLENPVGLLLAALLVLVLLGLLAGLTRYAPSPSPSRAAIGTFHTPGGRSGASHHLTGSEQLEQSD